MTTIEGTLHVDDEPKKTAELERIWAIWSRRKWLAILVFALPFAAATGAILSVASAPGRPVSESGRLCYGDGAHGRGGRRRMPLMSPSLYAGARRALGLPEL